MTQEAAAAARGARVAASRWTDEEIAAVRELGGTAGLAWRFLWDWVGRRDADVTALMDRVAGMMPESTWRGARRRLFDRGYLLLHRTPSGRQWVSITAQPAGCTRVAPDPQREFGFEIGREADSEEIARDLDGSAPPPGQPPTVALHAAGTTQAAPDGEEGPGARNPREIRADSAPPPQDQDHRERMRIDQDHHTKTKKPKNGVGRADQAVAEGARDPRGSRAGPADGPRPAGELVGQVLEAAACDMPGDWHSRQAIVGWVMARVPGAAASQAGICADAVIDGGVDRASLYRALDYAVDLARRGLLRKDLASAFFGAFKAESRRQGYQWPSRKTVSF